MNMNQISEQSFNKEQKVLLDYTNYAKQRSVRQIFPIKMVYEATQRHPEQQWLVYAWDIERKDYRYFAMQEMHP